MFAADVEYVGTAQALGACLIIKAAAAAVRFFTVDIFSPKFDAACASGLITHTVTASYSTFATMKEQGIIHTKSIPALMARKEIRGKTKVLVLFIVTSKDRVQSRRRCRCLPRACVFRCEIRGLSRVLQLLLALRVVSNARPLLRQADDSRKQRFKVAVFLVESSESIFSAAKPILP